MEEKVKKQKILQVLKKILQKQLTCRKGGRIITSIKAMASLDRGIRSAFFFFQLKSLQNGRKGNGVFYVLT
ncbi:MAG: hypothetical protein IJR83_03390 [Clostridia bacterium]|nr:hypothetical protein [Clostridia bacterium]